MELSTELLDIIRERINECQSVEDLKFTVEDLSLRLDQLNNELQGVYNLPKAIEIMTRL